MTSPGLNCALSLTPNCCAQRPHTGQCHHPEREGKGRPRYFHTPPLHIPTYSWLPGGLSRMPEQKPQGRREPLHQSAFQPVPQRLPRTSLTAPPASWAIDKNILISGIFFCPEEPSDSSPGPNSRTAWQSALNTSFFLHARVHSDFSLLHSPTNLRVCITQFRTWLVPLFMIRYFSFILLKKCFKFI